MNRNICCRNSLNESERLTLEGELQAADDEYFVMEETLAGTVDDHAARILVTRNCGHNLILANQQVFTQIIDFLKS